MTPLENHTIQTDIRSARKELIVALANAQGAASSVRSLMQRLGQHYSAGQLQGVIVAIGQAADQARAIMGPPETEGDAGTSPQGRTLRTAVPPGRILQTYPASAPTMSYNQRPQPQAPEQQKEGNYKPCPVCGVMVQVVEGYQPPHSPLCYDCRTAVEGM